MLVVKLFGKILIHVGKSKMDERQKLIIKMSLLMCWCVVFKKKPEKNGKIK